MSDGIDEGGEGIGQIYRSATPRIARVVTRMINRLPSAMSDDHEEVIQTVFLKALEGMRAGARSSTRTALPYLLAVARNAAWDLLRARRRSVFVTEVSDDVSDDHCAADPLEEAALGALQVYLASLPTQLASVFAFRFVKGYSQEQTCRELAISRQCLRTLERRLKDGALTAAGARMPGTRRRRK